MKWRETTQRMVETAKATKKSAKAVSKIPTATWPPPRYGNDSEQEPA